MFSSLNKILCTFLVEILHIKVTHLIVRSHLFLVILHLGQVTCAIVERFQVRTNLFSKCFQHLFRKFSELARTMLQHKVTHFHTSSKDFWVNPHIELTAEFCFQSLAQFLKAFYIFIVNPLALGFLLLLLGLLLAFFLS